MHHDQEEVPPRRLNARAELDKVPFQEVAREFLDARRSASAPSLWEAVFAPDFWRLLAEHVGLVAGSLLAGALVGIPLVIAAAKVRWLAQPVLVVTGLVQTIPALALLAVLIPLTGTIGAWPALISSMLACDCARDECGAAIAQSLACRTGCDHRSARLRTAPPNHATSSRCSR